MRFIDHISGAARHRARLQVNGVDPNEIILPAVPNTGYFIAGMSYSSDAPCELAITEGNEALANGIDSPILDEQQLTAGSGGITNNVLIGTYTTPGQEVRVRVVGAVGKLTVNIRYEPIEQRPAV